MLWITAKIRSLNVAVPRTIVYKGRKIRTAIFKEPVIGSLALRKLNLSGDRQADLKVHGGVDKAVYAYPYEHYDFWKRELSLTELSSGAFGENFTTEGLLEEEVFVGDRFRVGTAEITVTQPRLPCYKLAAKFQRDDMLKRFLASRKTGFYFSVVSEGEVTAGDEMILVDRESRTISIRQLVEIYLHPDSDRELLLRAIEARALPESWREHLIQKLA